MDKKNVKHTEPIVLPEVEVTDVFSKWRIITYAWIIFCPPYGLYRVWSPDTTFRRSERWVWSMIVILYVFYFIKLITG